MFSALARSTKRFAAAIGLLLLGIIVAEISLRFTTKGKPQPVSSRVADGVQMLLVPSATMHHEMQRLSRVRINSGPEFETNSLGLRATEVSRNKIAGVVRIVMLGDETVLSPSLDEKYTLPALLQAFLEKSTGRPIEVVNAGVPGYSPLLSVIQLRNALSQLSPDLVILHFDMTDVADDSVYRRMLRESAEQQICSNLGLTDAAVSDSPFKRVLTHSSLMQFIVGTTGMGAGEAEYSNLNSRYQWALATRTDLRLQIQHAMKPLEDFAKEGKQLKIPVLVATSPVPWQVAENRSFPTLAKAVPTVSAWPVTEDIPNRIMQAMCERLSLEFCDPITAFRSFEQPEKLFATDSVELSAFGNSLYARELAARLLQSPQFAGLFSAQGNMSAAPPNRN